MSQFEISHRRGPTRRYGAIWHGQKGRNGVAILARGTDPVERRRVLPGDPADLHSRYIEAQVGELLVMQQDAARRVDAGLREALKD